MLETADIIKNSVSDSEALGGLVDRVMHKLRASIVLLGTDGSVAASALVEARPLLDKNFFVKNNLAFLNQKHPHVFDNNGLSCLIIPVLGLSQRFGTLVAYSSAYVLETASAEILKNELAAAALILRCEMLSSDKTDVGREESVKAAIGSLSYSELNAVIAVFDRLEKNGDGLIVASSLSRDTGITRSVIVNALKKLESAAVIETQSRGKKGTFIHIVNPLIYKQLKHYC